MALKYRIGQIGWYNFERLIQALLKKIIGPGVTAFGGSKDGGRDSAYSGSANFPSKASPLGGYWVFQVKYIDIDEQGGASIARAALKSTFKKEILKIRGNLRIDNYILLTNVQLTSANRDDLATIAAGAGLAPHFFIVDGNEVCGWLDIYPELRRSFPQLLGLSDLNLILHSAIYSRSKAYFEQWAPRLSVFVQTEAYLKALQVLRKQYFLVLDGPPETGKSMIAAAVAVLHASEGYEIFDIRSPEQVHAIVREPGKKLFIADDAIGSVSLESGRNDQWARDLPGIVRLLDKTHLLIWTARHYILEEAITASALGDALDHFPGEREVVVEVGSLKPIEKAEIYYNHAKQAALTQVQKDVVRRRVRDIVSHPNFTPERIRQLVDFLRDRNCVDPKQLTTDMMQFINNPGLRWAKAYRSLSPSEQFLLVSLLDLDESPSMTVLQEAYFLRIQTCSKPLTFQQVLSRLRHSFITISKNYQGVETVNFKHPSLRDLLLGELRDDPIARRRYIELTSPVGLSRLIEGVGRRSGNDLVEFA